MVARPVWKGQLRLLAGSIPVEMDPATDYRSAISFRQIHKCSARPIQLHKVVPGTGPEKNEDICKGKIDSDDYWMIDTDEVGKVRVETRKTLELIQFVEVADIPLRGRKPASSPPQTKFA